MRRTGSKKAATAAREPAKRRDRHNHTPRITHQPPRVGDIGVEFPDEILTERLMMRAPTEDDAPEILARYAHDPIVCRYLSGTPHKSLDDTLAYLSRSLNKSEPDPIIGYLIFLRETGRLLGSVGGTAQNQRVGFGYCLARDAWGRGYATEAARAFVEAVMRQPTIWRIQAYCDVENHASARVLEQLGCTFESTLRRYMVLPNLGNRPRDVCCYAKVRE